MFSLASGACASQAYSGPLGPEPTRPPLQIRGPPARPHQGRPGPATVPLLPPPQTVLSSEPGAGQADPGGPSEHSSLRNCLARGPQFVGLTSANLAQRSHDVALPKPPDRELEAPLRLRLESLPPPAPFMACATSIPQPRHAPPGGEGGATLVLKGALRSQPGNRQ